MKWTEDWKNYPNYFHKPLNGPSAEPGSFIVGEELGRAVIANQDWLADKALIESVIARCAGPEMCDSLRGMLRWTIPPNQVSPPDTSGPLGFAYPFGFGVAQYGPRTIKLLDAKFKQFPRRTTSALDIPWS